MWWDHVTRGRRAARRPARPRHQGQRLRPRPGDLDAVGGRTRARAGRVGTVARTARRHRGDSASSSSPQPRRPDRRCSRRRRADRRFALHSSKPHVLIGGPLAIKLRSSMQRYGVAADELPTMLDRGPCGSTASYSTSPSPAPTTTAWPRSRHGSPTSPAGIDALGEPPLDRLVRGARRPPPPTAVPQLRMGTALWHGDKSAFHLGCRVVNEVRPVTDGARAGYRQVPVPVSGHLVMIGGGLCPRASAHSPTGEAPSTSITSDSSSSKGPTCTPRSLSSPRAAPARRVGEVVDVQRPLTQVQPDRSCGSDERGRRPRRARSCFPDSTWSAPPHFIGVVVMNYHGYLNGGSGPNPVVRRAGVRSVRRACCPPASPPRSSPSPVWAWCCSRTAHAGRATPKPAAETGGG